MNANRILTDAQIAQFCRAGVVWFTDNRATEGDRRARDFADKRVAFPPDIEHQDGKTYRFRV